MLTSALTFGKRWSMTNSLMLGGRHSKRKSNLGRPAHFVAAVSEGHRLVVLVRARKIENWTGCVKSELLHGVKKYWEGVGTPCKQQQFEVGACSLSLKGLQSPPCVPVGNLARSQVSEHKCGCRVFAQLPKLVLRS